MALPNIINDINELKTKHNNDISNLSSQIQTIRSSYLPLTGGALTGNLDIKSLQAITFGKDVGLSDCYIAHSWSNSGANEMAFHACSVADPYTGACMYLHTNKDTRIGLGGNEAGAFCLAARNGSLENINDVALQGYPNGGLYWNGYPMTQIGFPDYSKYYPTALPEYPTASKAIFTAPVDGWFWLYAERSPGGWTLNVQINGWTGFYHPAHTANYANLFIPLKRGDYIHVWCDNTSTTWHIWQQAFFGCRGNP